MADGLHGDVLLEAVSAVQHARRGGRRSGGRSDGAGARELRETLDAVVER